MTWYGIVWHGLAWQCGGRSCLLGWRRGGPLHDCSPLDDAIRTRMHGCCTRGCGSSAARSSTMLRPLPIAILACRPSSSLACIFDPLQPIGVLGPNYATEQMPRFRIEAERGNGPPLCRLQLVHLVLVNMPRGSVPFLGALIPNIGRDPPSQNTRAEVLDTRSSGSCRGRVVANACLGWSYG